MLTKKIHCQPTNSVSYALTFGGLPGEVERPERSVLKPALVVYMLADSQKTEVASDRE